MENNLSIRISILRFPLIVGVLFIHNYNSFVNLSNTEIGEKSLSIAAVFIRDYISYALSWISVPLFFLISGFLFFYDFSWSYSNFLKKLKSRISTLLIPFLFWNALVLTFIATAQALPQTSVFFSGNYSSVSSYHLFDYLNAIFGITQRPVSYQFWFIRDLFVLILLVPFIHFAINRLSYLLILFLFIIWFINYWPIYIPYIDSIFFFTLGSFLGIKKIDLTKIDNYGEQIIVFFLVVSVIDTLTKDLLINHYIHKVSLIIGLGFALHITRFLVNNASLKRFFLTLAPTSFFIFAAHEPLLMVLRKVLYKLLQPTTEYLIMTLYFSIPIIVLIICITAYYFLHKFTPNFTKIITGGR